MGAIYRRHEGRDIPLVGPDTRFFSPAGDLLVPGTFYTLDANNEGHVVFTTLVQTDDGSRETALIANLGDGYQTLIGPGARTTDREERIVTRILGSPSINDEGSVVFFGDTVPVDGRRRRAGLFLLRDGEWRTLALEGDRVPDSERATIGSVVNLDQPGRPTINARGDVLFGLGYADGRSGLWAYSAAYGAIYPLVLRGQQVDVNSDPVTDDMRTVERIIAGGGSTERPLNLADDGTVTLVLRFTDGSSGLFRTQVVGRVALPPPPEESGETEN